MNPPVRIEVESKSRMLLTWDDGAESDLSAAELRRSCPCADCRTERENPPRIRLTVIGSEPTIEGAHLVGDYGLGVTFGPDGHRTGIFTWQLLRSLPGPADSGGTRS